MPGSPFPRLTEILDLSLNKMLAVMPTIRLPGKRGPASRLEQQIDAISQLPKARQKVVTALLDAMLAQHTLQSAIEQEAATAP